MRREKEKKNNKGTMSSKVIKGAVAYGTIIRDNEFFISGSHKDSWTVKSSCVLAPIISNSVTTAITVDSRIPLHPLSLNSYRLKSIAKLFQSYRFKRIAIKWVPRVPTSTTGSVGLYYADDITQVAQSVNSTAPTSTVIPLTGYNLEATIEESEHGLYALSGSLAFVS
jgi:hypothetical protein